MDRPALTRLLTASVVTVLLAGLTVAVRADHRAGPVPAAPQAVSSAADPVAAAVAVGRPAQHAVPPTAARVAPAASRNERAARPAAATPEQRGRAALASLRYDWRRLGYEVRFRPYRGGQLGLADGAARVITVFVRPGQSELSLRATVAHELGHALDFEHGTEQRRRTYREVRGLGSASSWYPCQRCDDLASPAGDFAEVFAAWLVGNGDFRSRLGPPPTAAQLRRLTPLFHPAAPSRRPAGTRPSAAPSPASSPEPDRSLLGPLTGPRSSPSPSPGQERTVAP